MAIIITTSGIDVILGGVVIIISLLSLTFYFQILKVAFAASRIDAKLLRIFQIFHSQKNRFGTQVYRLMFQLGITDCLQLFFHTFGGIFSIANSDFNFVFNKVRFFFANLIKLVNKKTILFLLIKLWHHTSVWVQCSLKDESIKKYLYSNPIHRDKKEGASVRLHLW